MSRFDPRTLPSADDHFDGDPYDFGTVLEPEEFFTAEEANVRVLTAKRKLSCRAPRRSLLMQRRQALLLGLIYNLYRP